MLKLISYKISGTPVMPDQPLIIDGTVGVPENQIYKVIDDADPVPSDYGEISRLKYLGMFRKKSGLNQDDFFNEIKMDATAFDALIDSIEKNNIANNIAIVLADGSIDETKIKDHYINVQGLTSGKADKKFRRKSRDLKQSLEGDDEAYIADESSSQTTNTNWTQKLSLSFQPSVGGNFKVEWTMEVSSDTANTPVNVRVRLDDTTNLARVPHEGGNGIWYSVSGFSIIPLDEATNHTIDIDMKSEGVAGEAVKVRRSRILVTRF
jgi:hypothetical protein